MKRTSILIGILTLGTAAVTACNDGPSKAEMAAFLTQKLEEKLPGISVTTVKLDSARGNWVVIGATSGGPISYTAINLDVISMGMDADGVYNAIIASGANGYESVSKTGTYGNFYISGGGNVYEETSPSSKDLEKAAAAAEAVKYGMFSEMLSERYGLSEDRSAQVAKLAMQWNKLAKSRSMTAADAESFSRDLIGVNVSDAQAAYVRAQQGDSSGFDSLMEQAAQVNGVSPEHMSRIVSEIISE